MGEELIEEWQEYNPMRAPHVRGRHTKRRIEEGKPQPQLVEAHCEKCGARYKNTCLQGQPRQHISRFATTHAHAGPMPPPRVPR